MNELAVVASWLGVVLVSLVILGIAGFLALMLWIITQVLRGKM